MKQTRIPDLMDDALLNLGLRIYGFDCLGKPCKPIHTGNQDAVDATTGLVVAQMPIKNKDCEIKAIPELLKLLDIQGSVVTAVRKKAVKAAGCPDSEPTDSKFIINDVVWKPS